MKKNFIKYHSLGNDFVIFDWFEKKEQEIQKQLDTNEWPEFVKDICKRNIGIGADGVLILKKHTLKQIPEMLIYNADGSSASLCLNGLRCIAHYLYDSHKMPNQFDIIAGEKTVTCLVTDNKEIVTSLETNHHENNSRHTIEITNNILPGYSVNIGNPHFILLKKTTSSWLTQHGKAIETHPSFPDRTNVEFVWKEKDFFSTQKKFNVLVHERGCGITSACSSGAAAITHLLSSQRAIKEREKIDLLMQGGTVTCWVAKKNVYLQAQAHCVFAGKR